MYSDLTWLWKDTIFDRSISRLFFIATLHSQRVCHYGLLCALLNEVDKKHDRMVTNCKETHKNIIIYRNWMVVYLPL